MAYVAILRQSLTPFAICDFYFLPDNIFFSINNIDTFSQSVHTR